MSREDSAPPFVRRPRPIFILALAAAAATWWLAQDPVPTAPRAVRAAPPAPPAIVGQFADRQTLSGLWEEHGLPLADLTAVVDAGRGIHSWRSIRPGSEYRFTFAPGGALRELRVTLDRDRKLVVAREGDAFHARMIETPFVRATRQVDACVKGSPWQTMVEAGEDPALTVEMAEILGGQVDFYTDLRAGDCFEVAFSVDERPDGSYKPVSLDAIRLALRSKSVEAYRFASDGATYDYYDADGLSLKRRFLRSPLKFTRISSGFGMRMHPILRRARPHNGVDYVAPAGTPVQASGEGVVARAGRNGGYGLYVEIHHGDRYRTSYAHLSRIASGVRAGGRVSQGQVIGYVGSTGLSTGAHLDYRFMRDGRYVDPLSADLPAAEPLGGDERTAFLAHRDRVRQRLDAGRGRTSTPGGAVPIGG
ncbi:MAG TPA: peptidoglycan DD-metalloendopeptidase family protein [Gemmatimonadota bacterium]|nr:peptidoglycan DD-metalloendopeptidase family protein [Gemmatimonadota bacterium]